MRLREIDADLQGRDALDQREVAEGGPAFDGSGAGRSKGAFGGGGRGE